MRSRENVEGHLCVVWLVLCLCERRPWLEVVRGGHPVVVIVLGGMRILHVVREVCPIKKGVVPDSNSLSLIALLTGGAKYLPIQI